MKSQGNAKVVKNHPLGSMNVCTNLMQNLPIVVEIFQPGKEVAGRPTVRLTLLGVTILHCLSFQHWNYKYIVEKFFVDTDFSIIKKK